MEKIRLVVEIPVDLHHKFKVAATINGTSMTAILLQRVKDYVSENEKAEGK